MLINLFIYFLLFKKMIKYFIFIILFLSLIFFSKTQEDDQQDLSEVNDWEGNNFDYDDLESEAYFKNTLKEYLVEQKLFDSERVITRDEMKKIFIDVIFEGEPEGGPEFMKGVLEELTEYFINTYYKDRKEIKGKEIYDLIDIKEISMKFEQMIGENPYYNGNEDDMEENDYDSRDVVGDPSPDV